MFQSDILVLLFLEAVIKSSFCNNFHTTENTRDPPKEVSNSQKKSPELPRTKSGSKFFVSEDKKIMKKNSRDIKRKNHQNIIASNIIRKSKTNPVHCQKRLPNRYYHSWHTWLPAKIVTVAVNAWTLVAISLERFYAVCQPLRSRRWQTSEHACRVVISTWISSFVIMAPIACVSKLAPTQYPGKYKCRESWPNNVWESSFNLFLDGILLAIPLILMATAYLRIGLVLQKEITENRVFEAGDSVNNSKRNFYSSQISSADDCIMCKSPKFSMKWTKVCVQMHDGSTRSSTVTSQFQCARQYSSSESTSAVTLNMNSNNLERRLAIKKRVTCMLCIVVLEFFICWTPIYVINTISSFKPGLIYEDVGYFTISFFHLMSYVSSCCNPITYCFMNRNFRREFLQTFTRFCLFKRSTLKRSSGSNPVLN